MSKIGTAFLAVAALLLIGIPAFADSLCADSIGKDSSILPAINLKKIGPTTWDGQVGKTYVQVECVNDRIARVSYFYGRPVGVDFFWTADPIISLSNAIIKHGDPRRSAAEYKEYSRSGDNFCLYDEAAHTLYHSARTTVPPSPSCNRVDYVSDSLLALNPTLSSPGALCADTQTDLSSALSQLTASSTAPIPGPMPAFSTVAPPTFDPLAVSYVDDKHNVVEIRCTNTDLQRTLTFIQAKLLVDVGRNQKAAITTKEFMNVAPGGDYKWFVSLPKRAKLGSVICLSKEYCQFSDGETGGYK